MAYLRRIFIGSKAGSAGAWHMRFSSDTCELSTGSGVIKSLSGEIDPSLRASLRIHLSFVILRLRNAYTSVLYGSHLCSLKNYSAVVQDPPGSYT